MGIRAKLFLIFFLCGIAPMLLLGIFNYWSSAHAIEALLANDVEEDSAGIAQDIENALDEREKEMTELAAVPALRDYVSGNAAQGQAAGEAGATHPVPETRPEAVAQPASHDADIAAGSDGAAGVPENVRTSLAAFFESNRKYYAALTCLDVKGQPLVRLEEGMSGAGRYLPRFQTENFLPGSTAPDERVWTTGGMTPLRSAIIRSASGELVRYTVPVFTTAERGGSLRGALLLDLKLDAIFKEAARGRATRWSNLMNAKNAGLSPRLIIAITSDGQIVYHTNEVLNHQAVAAVMPFFGGVSQAMLARQAGSQLYDSPDGERWLAVYRPINSLDLSVAVAGDETAALHGLRRAGLITILLSTLVGALAAFLLAQVASRTARSIERVTEGAVAIAGGKLDQRIEVRSSDETRLLADTFNQMTDRLREQMVRETETQQFEAFIRISAMLTHDLKNAISALSLLVGNMERQFDNEEFRRDAMQSLKEAADKLRALVAKLSNPVETLSGEYKRPRPADLVPIIKRVLSGTAEPARSLYQIEASLPPSLVASVDAERIEKVVENLVINAIEAMGSKGGRLTVEAGPAGTDEIFFSVADTGPGMSEEFQRKKLFHPFKTTKSKGVGLGLYTCREVVKAHGGRIDVESKRGVGTCFRVVLPLAQKIIGPGEKSGQQSAGSNN